MNPSVRSEGVPLADFRRIFVDHHDFVVRNLRRLGIAEAQVDDAAQEVFLRVYRKYSGFRGDAPLRAWIYGFVRRVAAWFRRTEQRRERRHEAFRDHDRLSQSSASQAACLRLDAGLSLAKLLQCMNARDREIFVLVELEGLTGRELAAHQQISVPAAQARIRAARQRAHEVAARANKSSDHGLHPGLCAALLNPADVTLVERVPELVTMSGGTSATGGWSVFVSQTLELKSGSALAVSTGGWLGTGSVLTKATGVATGFAVCTTVLLGADQLPGATAAVVSVASEDRATRPSESVVAAELPIRPAGHAMLEVAPASTKRRRRARRPRASYVAPNKNRVPPPGPVHTDGRASTGEPSDAKLRDEMRLLQQAVRAHDRGQTEQCRRLLKQLEAQFPAGLLLRERNRLRQRLECSALGRGHNCSRD